MSTGSQEHTYFTDPENIAEMGRLTRQAQMLGREIGTLPPRISLPDNASLLDIGLGIAEEEIPHVFERFYRVKTRASSAISGFGIGLYVTKALVQAHGGRIWVESQPNRGSTFMVVLPLGTSLPPAQ